MLDHLEPSEIMVGSRSSRLFLGEGPLGSALRRLVEDIRHERLLRGVLVPDQVTAGEMTRRIAEVVKELGLQPWKSPEPLNPIDEHERDLVVWMGGYPTSPLAGHGAHPTCVMPRRIDVASNSKGGFDQ